MGHSRRLVYIPIYATLVALSVPGAAILTIAGGFLFGAWLGGLYAVIGATLGATAIFLAARAGLAASRIAPDGSPASSRPGSAPMPSIICSC